MYYFWVKKNIRRKPTRAYGRASSPPLFPGPRAGGPLPAPRGVPPPPSFVPPPSLPRLRSLPPPARPRCGPAGRRDWHPCGAPCLFRARRAQSGPAACSFPAGLREAPPLSFLYISRRLQPPDSPPPLAPAALDLPPAAAPRPGPMRGTGSRFGPSHFSLPSPPASPSLPRFPFFLPCSSAPVSPPLREASGAAAAAPGWGSPRETLWANIRCLEPLSARSLISRLSRRRERRIWCLSAKEFCVCVSCIHVPMVICRAPRWAESGELRRPLLLLSLLCVPFRFLPLLPEAGHRGALCLSVCPASLMLAALGCDRSRRGPRRRRWLRDGCHPPKGVLGLGAGHQPGLPAGTGPCGRHSPPGPGARCRSLSRCRRAHVGPGPCASHGSRVPFPPPPPPPPFRDLGLETSKQARRCAEKLTSLSGEVTLKGSPY